jgi:hypothetical protein
MPTATKRKPTIRKAPGAKQSNPTSAELTAIADTAFREASSGQNAEALGLASVIRDTLHTADLFDELEALNIVTARTFAALDETVRASLLEKYIGLLRTRALECGVAQHRHRAA